MANRILSRAAVVRITLDLLAHELSRSRGESAAALGRDGWGEATRLDGDGLGGDGLDLDSLERMDAASAMSELFHLHEYGAEDYLLALRSVGEWCDLIEQSLAATGERLTFQTSGSTGEPKRCTHALADLWAEAAGWARMFPATPRVVATVPAHHIFGTIFTALLPDLLGCAVATGTAAVRDAPAGTLVVGTPTHWAYLARALLAFPDGLAGVTSTAPMPASLAHRLRGQRLGRLVEVYGSSETGGVAMREREDAAYRLLDGWTSSPDGSLDRLLSTGEHATLASPDHLRWLDDRHFVLEGRRDGAVQIGGVNVFPGRVRDVLLAHAGVAEAAVRLEREAGRLKAFVVPAGDADPEGLAAELDRWCGDRLTAVERPRRWAVGGALPVNGMGKGADW